MFDVGFSEIVLIAVVCLIVIGPKRLPETVRFLGFWLGRIRRSLSNARAEMEREFGLDEIRRDLHNQELLQRLEDERKQVERAFNKTNKTSQGLSESGAQSSSTASGNTDATDFDDYSDAEITRTTAATPPDATAEEPRDQLSHEPTPGAADKDKP